ncbi:MULTISPECIES: enoyl-CoA hydratase/isomerase family protein [Rhizobium/Agrobacterium group]|uniref:enoyl-CoA hydratase/isomerase family protein n=1 Tax=Rhizobium/Agrobacterium group TaxID=227290 RepID=UPI000B403B30|nr:MULTISPECIES: enoyl-CoA hydratase/isomerase family protein [Rhizobium/Agrobacterium group]MCF1485429.1 enoyl-CoA hydratase/isomerase family protein [Allorhizobium ampelinum]NSZ45711.1 enoyl-CoA hydratase/isomerase family protein [Agrobacterium vitis]NTA29889.1 enoyl-CoA hydratase/isomerase family protein [Allorhizobium ampelinum]OVE87585.1 enoyl-CoA hydratase [Allorhizobium ampelinum]
MIYKTLDLELNGAVATVWMNRPDLHNAFDEMLIQDMTLAIEALSENDSVRVLVLAGRGASFSAGADLAWMKRQGAATVADNFADAAAMGRMFMALRNCPKPLIARIQGAAIGGGMGLVAACDIAVAAPGTVFATSEVRLALIPAVISPLVAAAIGERQCRRYFLTGERMGVEKAHALGLVHEIAEKDGLDDAVKRIVADVLKGAPGAVTEAKALITQISGRRFDAALVSEMAERIAARRGTDEAREGLSAFLEKRKPGWIADRKEG